MLYKILDYINHKDFISELHAHCDIPCKIYEPLEAQVAVLTIIRTTDLINELIEKV
jgi:nickel superoxide dismutase